MNWLARLLLMFLGQRAKARVMREVKKRGVLAYLKVVQGSRRALIGLLLVLFVFQVMMIALTATVVCGVLLWEADPQLKLQVLFGISATLFVLPFLALVVILSERLWYKASGAERMVREVRDRHAA